MLARCAAARPLRVLVLLLLLAVWSPARAPAETLQEHAAGLARDIAARLRALDQKAVAIGEFTAPPAAGRQRLARPPARPGRPAGPAAGRRPPGPRPELRRGGRVHGRPGAEGQLRAGPGRAAAAATGRPADRLRGARPPLRRRPLRHQ